MTKSIGVWLAVFTLGACNADDSESPASPSGHSPTATCTCDTSDGCDGGCSCDPDCGGCPCDEDPACQDGCDCDQDCVTCTCDTTSGCDNLCAHDPDCTGGDAGFYPYVPCGADDSCDAGMCMGIGDDETEHCVEACPDEPMCANGFTCMAWDGVGIWCAKTCSDDSECNGTEGADCCVTGICLPAPWCGSAPDGWTCDPAVYDAWDGCDCGCGVEDPDCEGDGCADMCCSDRDCDYCYDPSGAPIACAR